MPEPSVSDPPTPDQSIAHRKADHLELCATGPVGFQGKSTLLDEVELIHNALPEVAWQSLDTSISLLGKTLRAPLVIASMSGGTPEAVALNFALARAAERHGIALALGSQRALLVPGRLTDGFFVREFAPTTLLLGNLGAVQARDLSPDEISERLIEPCGLDALCIHLNPAQELIQPGGDRDFEGCEAAISMLARSLAIPIVVKETGCGLSRAVGERLVASGVTHVDVSGAGGTSWVGVETLRAEGLAKALGETFWDWGIPTAGSLLQLSGLPLVRIATGGIRHGLDGARALALGATAVGVARPFLQAWRSDGDAGLDRAIEQWVAGLKVAMLLTGSRSIDALRAQPVVLGSRLQRWLMPGTPAAQQVLGMGLPSGFR